MNRLYAMFFLMGCVFTNMHSQMSLEQIKTAIGQLYTVPQSDTFKQKTDDYETYKPFLDHIAEYDNELKKIFVQSFINKPIFYIKESVNKTGHDYFASFDAPYANLQILTLSLSKFLCKKYNYQTKDQDIQENKTQQAAELFDDLLALRLLCAENLKKIKAFENKDLIVNFSPLAVSRWNPFYWGNWYDRLHRTIVTLPSLPWDENSPTDKNKALVESHMRAIEGKINNLDGKSTTEKVTLQIYILVMRELRILIKQQLTTTGRKILRWVGGGAGVLAGLGLAARYFMSGKKANSENNLSNERGYTLKTIDNGNE